MLSRLSSPYVILPAVVMAYVLLSLPSMLGTSWETMEATSWQWSRLPPDEAFRETSRRWHPPAYFVALGLWMDLFGEREWVSRLPSLIFVALSIPCAYGIGRFAHSRAAGAVLAALWATSPLLFTYAILALNYAVLYLSVTVALMCLAYLLQLREDWELLVWSLRSRPDRRRLGEHLVWAGLALGLSLALLVHFVAVLLPVLTAAVIGLAVIVTRRNRRYLLVNALVVHGLVSLFYLACPWGYAAFQSSPSSLGMDLTVMGYVRALVEIHGATDTPWAVAFALFAAGVGVWRWVKERRLLWLAFALTVWLFPILFVVLSEPILGSSLRSRAFLWVTPGFYLLVAAGIMSLRPRRLAWALLSAVLLVQIYSLLTVYTDRNPPWNELTAELMRRSEPGDVLYICPEGSVPFAG